MSHENRQPLNLLVSGANMSGSTALLDLISEYDGIGRIPREFDDFRRSGLIGDVIMGHAKVPDQRQRTYIVRNFTVYSPFIQHTRGDKIRYRLKSLIKIGKNYRYLKRAQLLESVLEKCYKLPKADAVVAANQYVNKVAALYTNYSIRLIDKPIFSNVHTEIWAGVFEPFKLIIVHRSLADQVGQILDWRMGWLEMDTPIKSIQTMYGNDRAGMIRFHKDVIKARVEAHYKLIKLFGKNKVLIIQFEDLVHNYYETKSIIESFIGISPKFHTRPKTKFDPSISINNIGIGKRLLSKEELNILLE